MGGHGGRRYYIRNIVYYTLSPFHQAAFVGSISKGIPNVFKRISYQIPYIIPRK